MVAILPNRDQVVIDPAVLKFTRLVAEQAHELMWDIGPARKCNRPNSNDSN